MHTDTTLIVAMLMTALFVWYTTDRYYCRKIVREQARHHKALVRMDDAAFELGRIAGRDEERRDFTTIELAGRSYDLPSN